MLSGKPYISTKSAMMKAAKAPKVRQSRAVWSSKKLNANITKIAVFRTTSAHSP